MAEKKALDDWYLKNASGAVTHFEDDSNVWQVHIPPALLYHWNPAIDGPKPADWAVVECYPPH